MWQQSSTNVTGYSLSSLTFFVVVVKNFSSKLLCFVRRVAAISAAWKIELQANQGIASNFTGSVLSISIELRG